MSALYRLALPALLAEAGLEFYNAAAIVASRIRRRRAIVPPFSLKNKNKKGVLTVMSVSAANISQTTRAIAVFVVLFLVFPILLNFFGN